MVVAFDGIKVTGGYDLRDTAFSTFYAETPAHAPGPVDVVVTNPDGQSQRLVSGYSFAPQGSFDLNGAWSGMSLHGTDTAVDFVIRNNKLVIASCQSDVRRPFIFAYLPTVEDGAFSFTADDGATIGGRIVSASEILGTMSFAPCTNALLTWRARRYD